MRGAGDKGRGQRARRVARSARSSVVIRGPRPAGPIPVPSAVVTPNKRIHHFTGVPRRRPGAIPRGLRLSARRPGNSCRPSSDSFAPFRRTRYRRREKIAANQCRLTTGIALASSPPNQRVPRANGVMETTMGIYGALSTAVTGLRAQSFALENISGNIANSQTTGFKRIDTDFVDMIPDAAQQRQTAGSVLAYSRSTNNLQGDIKGTLDRNQHGHQRQRLLRGRAGRSACRTAIRCSPAPTTTPAAATSSSTRTATSSTARATISRACRSTRPPAEYLGLGAAGAARLRRVPAGPADDAHQLRAEPAAVAQNHGLPGCADARQRAARCARLPEPDARIRRPRRSGATATGTDPPRSIAANGDTLTIDVVNGGAGELSASPNAAAPPAPTIDITAPTTERPSTAC